MKFIFLICIACIMCGFMDFFATFALVHNRGMNYTDPTYLMMGCFFIGIGTWGIWREKQYMKAEA